MTKISLVYSEDFRENKIAGKVYGRLRDMGFNPTTVNVNYIAKLGVFSVEYNFRDEEDLPESSRLEKILRELNLTGVEVSSTKDWLSVVAK